MIHALSSPSPASDPNRLPAALSACQTCPGTETSPGWEKRPCLFLLGSVQARSSFQIESPSVWPRLCCRGEQEQAFSPVAAELMLNKKPKKKKKAALMCAYNLKALTERTGRIRDCMKIIKGVGSVRIEESSVRAGTSLLTFSHLRFTVYFIFPLWCISYR